MRNNEYLALFVLGIGTLGITFLLLFAMNDKSSDVSPSIGKQVSVSVAQADVTPQAPIPAPSQELMSMEVLDRQVSETFAKTASYLGRGVYEEKEHVALLERLELYSGMSSIKPEHKKTAQDFIQDMDRLLTLRESVARQLQLKAQITAVETDVQIHLAKGVRNEAVAKKLMDRIESLYAIRGLSEEQNEQLRTSLAARKSAYKDKPAETSTASASAPVRHVEAPKVTKTAAPVEQAKPQPKPEPKPIAKAPVTTPAQKKVEQPTPKVQVAAAAPKPAPQPVTKAPAAAPAPDKVQQRKDQETRDKYYEVMTHISRYFVVKRYNQEYHEKLTADLLEIQRNKAALSKDQQDRLAQTISKMKYINDKYGPVASSK